MSSLKVMHLCRAPLSLPKKRGFNSLSGLPWDMQGHWQNDWHRTSPSELWQNEQWPLGKTKAGGMSEPHLCFWHTGDSSVQKPWACGYWSTEGNRLTHPVTRKPQGPHMLGAAVNHTGWRNSVPRAGSSPKDGGWATGSVHPPRQLPLGQGESSQECCINRVPATWKETPGVGKKSSTHIVFGIGCKSSFVYTLKSNTSKYKLSYVSICVFY